MKQSKRSLTVDIRLGINSLEEFLAVKNAFLTTYPRQGKNNEDSWDILFAAYLSLVISGVIPSESPKRSFYSIRLRDIDIEKGTLRVNRQKNPKKKESGQGQRIYLPAIARLYLYSYLRFAKQTFLGYGNDKLVPAADYPEKDFFKRFKTWMEGVCAKAGLKKSFSTKDLIYLARVDLLDVYPPFLLAVVSSKIQYSSTPDHIPGREPIPDTKDMLVISDQEYAPASVIPKIIEKIDGLYGEMLRMTNTLSQRSTRDDRTRIKQEIISIQQGFPKDSPSPDDLNLLLVSEWLRDILLPSRKLKPNSVRSYFSQVATVLRTEMQGQSLENLTHGDMESIIENCELGGNFPFKAAIKSFLTYVDTSHNIKTGHISWKQLTVSREMKDVPILWPSDVKKILEKIGDRQLRGAILLGFYCGLRIGEITALRFDDFDLYGESYLELNKSKTVSGKRRLPLFLLLDSQIYSEVSDICNELFSCTVDYHWEELFLNDKKVPYSNPQVLSMAVQRVMAKAGYDWATFHTLRHSFASILLLRWFRAIQGGILFDHSHELDEFDIEKDRMLLTNGLPDSARLLGHADVRTTVTNYIHTIDILQKVYLDRYEIDNPFNLTHEQGRLFTGLSKAGIYKAFPASGVNGIEAEKLLAMQMRKLGNFVSQQY